jgi:doublesex- and mab-3-related transcription factor 4/5
MPPGAFGAASRYPFLQQQAKRFLSAPYSGTGYLPTVIQDNDNEGAVNNGGENQD